MSNLCRIATRASPLAVWQAEHVARLLEKTGNVSCELVRITTEGDRLLDRPLTDIGGKGLFLKELEQSLLAGETDLAVHSMKDVPAQLADGLTLAAITSRADVRDALIGAHKETLAQLAPTARIGTGSLRRQTQLRRILPDAQLIDLRGNVGTRLARLDDGDFDAIVLACAGLDRLGLGERISERLATDTMLPAIGQGALGLEVASTNAQAQRWAMLLHDALTAREVAAERAIAQALGADCRTPLAAYAVATPETNNLHVQAYLSAADGSRIAESASGGTDDAVVVAAVLDDLSKQGAADILAELTAQV